MDAGYIKFYRWRDVKLPDRAHPSDAGIDFFVPAFNKEFISDLRKKNPDFFEKSYDNSISEGISLSGTFSSETLTIKTDDVKVDFDLSDSPSSFIKYDEDVGLNYFLLPPMARINIPSGIMCKLSSPNMALIAFNKSGISTKFGLVVGAQVVDYGYQGEIHINVINTSSSVVRIYEHQKLVQFIELPVSIPVVKEVKNFAELHEGEETERGADGFGSTD